MPGRNYINGSSYRYGFNGHEKDDEIKGSGNHLSFGDYGYDPRLVRRWNVDPLASKYPHQSPYTAFNNNPIYYTDPDGREGIGAINHKEQTVTIRAVYFVEIGKEGFNEKNLEQLEGLNATLNDQKSTITDEKNALHGYTVQYDLQFIPVKKGEAAIRGLAESEKILTDNNLNADKELIVGGKNIANSLILKTDYEFENDPGVLATAKTNGVMTSDVLGITDKSLQHIAIPQKSQGNSMRALHEIFHTLYVDKDGAFKGIGTGKQLPSKDDTNKLIEGLQKNDRLIEEKQ
jgi:hypothetical protein